MGVNVSSSFLGIAERFLHCRVGSIPFTYLGLQVGVQPRREGIWLPLLDLISRRLGVWSNRYIILGGRVVLLNSVLNSIPIFYLSFLSEGGLGVRDLRMVNLALLGKWRWRLISGAGGLWKDIVCA
ncbi:ribonuclease H, partial [Trifolium pratense]